MYDMRGRVCVSVNVRVLSLCSLLVPNEATIPTAFQARSAFSSSSRAEEELEVELVEAELDEDDEGVPGKGTRLSSE